MSGASEKRIAIACALAGRADDSRKAYRRSREFYRAALDADPLNHWVITQYLSLVALPDLTAGADRGALADRYGAWWAAARQIASWKLRRAAGVDAVWALGTLAELELLGAAYLGTGFDRQRCADEVGRLCQRIRELAPAGSDELNSTLRQFRRYASHWQREEWADAAGMAVAVLGAADPD